MPRERPRTWLCGGRSGEEYEAAFDALAADGKDVHGEARFVEELHPRSVLDAGCGTGRIARELARRGIDIVGVDLDTDMFATARDRAPDLDWRLGDLATVDLGRSFDLVLMAGNVMIFLEPGTEAAVLANMVHHLLPGGLLVAGFQLDYGLSLGEYDAMAAQAGLILRERWATWDRMPWQPGGNYAVSTHVQQDSKRALYTGFSGK